MPDKYDVDYSRFDDVNDSDDEVEEVYTDGAKGLPDGTAYSNRQMPPEMVESMRLMQEGRRTGDRSKMERAEELAKQAMELDPVLRQNVNAMQKKQNRMAPNPAGLPIRDYTTNFDDAQDPLAKAKSVTENINRLKADMEAQLAALKKQEDMINGKSESIQNCDSPESMAAFMEAEGFTEDEIEKAFSGDSEAAAEVLKTHTDFKIPGLGTDTTYQDQILGQVDQLNTQLQALDGAEEKLKNVKGKKKGKGKKGRGKKGKGGKQQEIEDQKAKLQAIRSKLQNKLKAGEAAVAAAAKKQQSVKAELEETEARAKAASEKIDSSVEEMQKDLDDDSDSDSDDEEIKEKKRNLDEAKKAQAHMKAQQARLESGDAPEEVDISTAPKEKEATKRPAKIEGSGWGKGGFFKKDGVADREKRNAAKKVEKEAAKKEEAAKAKARKAAAVKASVEKALGMQKASIDSDKKNTAASRDNSADAEEEETVLDLGDDDTDAATLMQEAADLMEESKALTEDSEPESLAAFPCKETTPEYVIKRLKGGRVSVVISLPELASMVGVDLDVSENQLKLGAGYTSAEVEKCKYALTVNFTDKLDQSGVTAKFSKKKSELKVTIPTIQ